MERTERFLNLKTIQLPLDLIGMEKQRIGCLQHLKKEALLIRGRTLSAPGVRMTQLALPTPQKKVYPKTKNPARNPKKQRKQTKALHFIAVGLVIWNLPMTFFKSLRSTMISLNMTRSSPIRLAAQ